jgi:hypothetical protein
MAAVEPEAVEPKAVGVEAESGVPGVMTVTAAEEEKKTTPDEAGTLPAPDEVEKDTFAEAEVDFGDSDVEKTPVPDEPKNVETPAPVQAVSGHIIHQGQEGGRATNVFLNSVKGWYMVQWTTQQIEDHKEDVKKRQDMWTSHSMYRSMMFYPSDPDDLDIGKKRQKCPSCFKYIELGGMWSHLRYSMACKPSQSGCWVDCIWCELRVELTDLAKYHYEGDCIGIHSQALNLYDCYARITAERERMSSDKEKTKRGGQKHKRPADVEESAMPAEDSVPPKKWHGSSNVPQTTSSGSSHSWQPSTMYAGRPRVPPTKTAATASTYGQTAYNSMFGRSKAKLMSSKPKVTLTPAKSVPPGSFSKAVSPMPKIPTPPPPPKRSPPSVSTAMATLLPKRGAPSSGEPLTPEMYLAQAKAAATVLEALGTFFSSINRPQ